MWCNYGRTTRTIHFLLTNNKSIQVASNTSCAHKFIPVSQLHVKHEATHLSTRLRVCVLKYYCINPNSQAPYMLCLASEYISFLNETLHTATPTWTLIGNFSVSTFHTAMCSLIYCWNVCCSIYQHGYSSALFIHFGWCEQQTRKQYFSPQNVLLVSAPVSSDFHGLASPGSAPLHLRRAGLTSVASVEECDDCRLYHSDSAALAWFAPGRSAPPWCLGLRLIFILRGFFFMFAVPAAQHYYTKCHLRQEKKYNLSKNTEQITSI